MVRCVRCGAGIGAEHVRERGPHGQDQNRQASTDRDEPAKAAARVP